MSVDDERYMRLAIQSAHKARGEGNDPYGSVVVRSGDVVEGHNIAHTTCDPTAHAELVAIRNAASAWSSVDLRGATLYASFEPCPMCLGAMLASGISELVIG